MSLNLDAGGPLKSFDKAVARGRGCFKPRKQEGPP